MQTSYYACKPTSFRASADRDAIRSFPSLALACKEHSGSGLYVWGWECEILSFDLCLP